MTESPFEALLRDVLACPVCHRALVVGDGGAACTGCGRRYGRDGEGVIDFLPDPVPDADVAEQWPLWEQLEHNGSVAYEQDPQNNLSIGPRADYQAFAEWARLDGLVLDVGCGPQSLPWYGKSVRGTLVGIDPLRGAARREFAFVRGVGEYLPFGDASFDRVLFTTSIDHVLVPVRALAEAARAVAPTGQICIWFGEQAASTKSPDRPSHSWYDALEVPNGAVDRFHARRFTADVMRELIAEAGLELVEMKRLPDTASIFLRVTR